MVPLGLTAASSATDTVIKKEIFGSSITALLISNEELNDIIKIFEFLEDYGLLETDYVSETDENEVEEQKGGILGMLAATLGFRLLGNIC